MLQIIQAVLYMYSWYFDRKEKTDYMYFTVKDAHGSSNPVPQLNQRQTPQVYCKN